MALRTPKQILVAVDQLFNTFFLGWADETLSARAWRKQFESKRWALARKVIDKIFFWEHEHCRTSYISERLRRHLPDEYREAV